MQFYILGFLALFVANASIAEPVYQACIQDLSKYELRTLELKQLAEQDQADRDQGTLKPGTSFRDRQRRQRVGEIFGEGCFKSADDFAHAAIIYQHGGDIFFDASNTSGPISFAPDQIFQAFIWAKRAVELGDQSSKWLMAAAIDRYLWFTGKKQLFGTQGSKIHLSDPCWCLVPTETSFPDTKRLEYTGLTLQQALENMRHFPNQSPSCPLDYCAFYLQSTPAGSVPGFW